MNNIEYEIQALINALKLSIHITQIVKKLLCLVTDVGCTSHNHGREL